MLQTWNHHLVSGSRNITQTGSHTQVRDHKWVLDLSLDDDDGGCNRSTEHLAVGNFAIDRAIGARRACYSSPSNSSRVKPPTSQDRKKPTMRVKGQGNPHQDHLAKAIWLRSARQPWSHASATDTLAKKNWPWRMILGFPLFWELIGVSLFPALFSSSGFFSFLCATHCNSSQEGGSGKWNKKTFVYGFNPKTVGFNGMWRRFRWGWAVPAEEVELLVGLWKRQLEGGCALPPGCIRRTCYVIRLPKTFGV